MRLRIPWLTIPDFTYKVYNPFYSANNQQPTEMSPRIPTEEKPSEGSSHP